MAVRRESVQLILEDRFTAPILRAAAATAVYRKELQSLSGTEARATKTGGDLERQTDGVGKSARRTEKDIDKLSGRIRIIADIAASLGPASVPIGTVAVPAVAGLAAQLGFAAAGAGVAVLAFQGVGDALEAVNKAALEPTTENLQAARDAMADLTPETRRFIGQLREMAPELKQLRNAAGSGLFPGLTIGLDQLEGALPRVERLVSAISAELGDIAAESGESLASDRWAPFLDFVADEAPEALDDLASVIGNITHAMAGMWMAFDPLNDDFSQWLVDATADLDDWAAGLSRTEGFQEFVDYIRSNGPQVGETLNSIANAVLEIVEAAAPLGGPVLRILETLADVVADIADSDLGTPIFGLIGAMGALNTAMRVYKGLATATFGGPAIAAILANEAALARLGMTSKSAGAGMASLKRGAGAAAAVLAVGVALHQLEKDDPTESVDRFVASLKDIKSGAPEAREAVNDLFGATGSAWAVLTSGSVSEITSIQDAVEALDQGWFSTFGTWANKGFGIWATNADLATSAFEKSDAALGQLVADGKIDEARTAFSYLADEARRAGMPVDELRKLFPEYTRAMDYATEHQEDFARAQKEMEAEQLRTDLRATAKEFVNLGDSLADADISLDTWIRKLEIQASALRQFGENATTGLRRGVDEGLIEQFRSEGPGGARMLKALAKATDAQIAAANKAFRGGLIETKRFWTEAGKQLVPLLLRVNADPAEDGIRDLLGMLDLLVSRPRTIGVNVKVNVPKGYDQGLGSLLLGPIQGTKNTGADGATVPKTGRPYADRHLYLLADGEEIISNRNGEADDYRSDRDSGRIPRYADGGTTGRSPMRNWVSGGDAWTQVMGAIATAFKFSIPDSLRDWQNALKRSEQAIDKEREKRDELVDLRNSLVADVAGKLRRDLFTTDNDSSVWMSDKDRAKAGVGDVFSTLQGDITDATAFGKALKQLTRKGLNGAAFAEVAQNADLAQAQGLAGMNAKDVRRYEWLYNRRQQVTGDVGSYAGNATYGRQIAAQTRALTTLVESNRRIDTRLARLEKLAETNPAAVGKAVGTAVDGAMPKRRG